ncbi:unnamed protein product [Ilex paraguariensis]|uniref:Diacylglycerol O-acyltransferase n=1 Tax=Ilex paraguariensis TaxID=185542 RepID=A0ABC8RXS9_9AQUA
MGFEEEEVLEPVSPIAHYLNSSVLSISILCVLEIEVPIDDSQTMSLLQNVFLPINPRFSSVMARDGKGEKKWKRVAVNLQDHVIVPVFPQGKSEEFYNDYFSDYLTNIGMDQFPQNRPLWEIHIIKYPTSNAAGSVIFKIHHSLGDGYSLMGALLSCLQRADNPSLPLTFPSRQSSSKPRHDSVSIFRWVPRFISGMVNSVSDIGWSLLKSSVVEDDQTPIRSGEDGVQFRPVTITTITFHLEQIKQIKASLKVSINDVITGIIFLGTRLYMQATGHEFGSADSTALVLFNTRAMEGYKSVNEMVKTNSEMPWGNRFTFLQVSIPKLTVADSSNPLRFVFEAHQLIKRKRNSFAVVLNSMLLETLRKLRGSEAASKLFLKILKSSSILISNMIGPVEQMALASHNVSGMYFTVAGNPENAIITIVSYMGKLMVSMAMDKDFINSHKFKECIENAYEIILTAAIQKSSS